MNYLSKCKQDYECGSYKIRKQALFCKIEKLRDLQWDEVKKMQDNGFDISSYYKDDYEKSLNLFKCYDELFKSSPVDNEELLEIEWLFNNGRLRTDQEIKDRISKRNGKENLSNTIRKLSNKRDKEDKSNLAILLFVSPIIPTIITELISIDYQSNLIYWMTFDILTLFSFIIHCVLFGFLSVTDDYKYHKNIKEAYKQAGESAPIDINLIASVSSYCLFLHSTLKKKNI